MSEPTIVCVLGMHRSGTSLVTRVLNVLGLDLGPTEHLMRPSSANPAGHWESLPIKEINDEILEHLGGSWFDPPEFTPGWERAPGLADARRQARGVLEADFSGAELWGFKDPRVSLTAPFWQRLIGPMRYLVCVRNPIDVAASLAAREAEPVPFEQGVELWLTYMRAALAASAGHRREFVFYEDLMADPEPVVERLARFIGTHGSESAETDASVAVRVAVSEGLWHHRSAVPNVVDAAGLPFHVKALYLALRLFEPAPERVGDEALELFATYADGEGRRRAELEAGKAELTRVRELLDDVERRREAVEQRLAEREADLEQAQQARAEEKRLRRALEAALNESRAEAGRLREAEVARKEAEFARLKEAEAESKSASAGTRDRSRAEVRMRAEGLIPAGSTVLVAAKGDDALLELEGSRGLHFPATPDGRYAGFHPAGDTAVIAQLEAQRAGGADHLLLPATTLWWLDHYQGLRRHLDERYERLVEDEHCAIYRLSPGDRRRAADPIAVLKRTVASLRIRSGRDPSILDWRTGLGIADQVPDMLVFEPPGEDPSLPYMDGTVDIVVLGEADSHRIAEARRVAAGALITVDPSSRERAALEWLADGTEGWGADVSVTLFPRGDHAAWGATVRAVAETLDGGFAGELTVVGDRTGLASVAERAATAGLRVRSIEVGTEASLAQRARAAIGGGDRPIHALVTEPAVPLPDWLPSVLPLFSGNHDAGVVGARILSHDGALEEAGGILDGGHPRSRGEGDSDPDRPDYRFVQRVDFCSPPLLATRRDLFERLGGFDERRAAAADAVVDYSLRAGRSGAPVYYQPEARVVAMGNGRR